MDPFSISVSVLGILGAAQQAVKGVGKLRSLKHAKEDFSSLLNELADIQTILTQVTHLSYDLDARASDGPVVSLKSLLKRASDQLLELNKLVQHDLSKPKPEDERGVRIDRLGWTLNESRVQSIQRQLTTTRSNIATALGLVSS